MKQQAEPLAPHRQRRTLSEFWSWRPARIGADLFLLIAGWAAAQQAGLFSPAVEPGVDVDLPQVTGTVQHGVVQLDLPYTLTNGGEQPLRHVEIWVRVYACRAQTTPLGQCMQVQSTRQEADTNLNTGESETRSDELNLELPDDRPGDVIRVNREVDTIRDQSDLDRAEKYRPS